MPTPQRSNARESLSFRNLPLRMRDSCGLLAGACGFAVYTRGDTHLGQPHLQRQLGIRLGFDFLKSQASFDIGDLIPYNPSNSFARAMLVGLFNSCE